MDVEARRRDFEERAPELVAALGAWFEQEASAIDGSMASGAPAGTGGSVVGMRPAIDSKRVLDATVVTKKVLGIDLPPEIIKPGGYDSFDGMVADLVPKLSKVFTGEIKPRKRQEALAAAPA